MKIPEECNDLPDGYFEDELTELIAKWKINHECGKSAKALSEYISECIDALAVLCDVGGEKEDRQSIRKVDMSPTKTLLHRF